VRLGILYADTLAAVQSGAGNLASHRLDVLIHTLASLQAPPALSHYLRLMQRVLEHQQVLGQTQAAGQRQLPRGLPMGQLVALFEPLYEVVYATDPTAEAWGLFRLGAWLENLALAAAVGNQGAVRQMPAIPLEADVLRQLHLSEEVLTGLVQLQALTAQQPLTAQDLQAIQTRVDMLQQVLSGGTP
jgi:hypothetical protein